ncbi:biotin--[acetyl-CoA-carboxylase] ligase [Piscibacillus salipiscarius]|uniref:Bifunctional ligase/repressor BirA n=1 Tax=Piscibacillus salipiscarius TaxID=299480 RepID=A0ABW5QEB9_9BACI|nr:biotin--[acetyl-CoA-carboxylase] ligase [Piscibacillus salipiscarius]
MEGTRKRLIDLLSNHQQPYISGQQLSDELNISRSAVWKHMNALKKEGYQIEGVTNKGYRIVSSPNDLSETALSWDLKTDWLGQRLIYKEQVTSTQIVAHDLARDGAEHGTVIVAREQTKGRGRMRRYWESKDGLGLWFSSILRPTGIEPKRASQLTLVAAVAIADYLSKYNLDVKIKWPNDLFINGKKLAGILTEMQAEQDAVEYIVLGIGINMNHDQQDLFESERNKATSLLLEAKQPFNLNTVLTELLFELEVKFDLFMSEGFSTIKGQWESYAYKLGEWVSVKTQTEWDAKICGIDEDGALMVMNQNHQVHHLYSAEILW